MSIKTPTEILRSFKYTLNNAIKKDLSKIEELQLNAEFNKELNKQIYTYEKQAKKYKTNKAQQKRDFIDQQSAISYNMMVEDQRLGHEEDAREKQDEQAKLQDAINSINIQAEQLNQQEQITKQYSIYNNEKYPIIECLKPIQTITIEKIENPTQEQIENFELQRKASQKQEAKKAGRPKKYKVNSQLTQLTQQDMQEALNRALIKV